MNKNSYIKLFLFTIITILFASCENDFNEIGTDIVGNDHFEFGDKETYQANASNFIYGAAESSNLAVNPLGIYNNPVFGVTKANLATQLQLASPNPTIDLGLVPVIESVTLNIPYFVKSSKTVTNTDGTHTYVLDSIFGASTSNKIKLSIYESGYLIRGNVDPLTGESYPFYNDQNNDFDAVKGTLLNDTTASLGFVFSPAEYTEEVIAEGSTTATTKYYPPAMRMELNDAFFQSKIFSAAAAGKLLNNNIFNEYFKGLYFKVENFESDAGNLALINFKGGTITIKYKQKESATVTTTVDKTIVLNLTGKSVSLVENTPVSVSNNTRLYVKGGNGSMAVINLFNPEDLHSNGISNGIPNEISDELEQIRANNWLVNDASLTFTIDTDAMNVGTEKAIEAQRLYLYDINNKKPITDYYTDFSSSSNAKNSKKLLGGILEKGANGRGTQYKIRLTNYIRNLINNDTVTNVKLGLVVTEDISSVTNKKLKNVGVNNIKVVPTATVLSSFGTVLFGSNIPASDPDYAKRLKLEIYYTKPKQN